MNNKQKKKLSKTMSYLLRHKMDTPGDGYVTMDSLCKELAAQRLAVPIVDILQVVTECSKQRFGVKDDNKYIRANQGHSTDTVKSEELLKPIDVEYTKGKEFIHGTFKKNLDLIQKTGLNRCARKHIHLTTGLPGDKEVISGMRSSCQVAIYVDVAAAINDGIKFWISENSVILTEGNEDGAIDPKYFSDIVEL
jgi:2'-phosphotransferase